MAGQLPQHQQDQRQLECMPAGLRLPGQPSGSGLRPEDQPGIDPVGRPLHQQPAQPHHRDGDEDNIQLKQLAAPDHQVADPFRRGQQLDNNQRHPGLG